MPTDHRNLMSNIKTTLLNIFVYSLKKLGLKPFVPTNQKRLLIVTTTGLGDTLWATPSISSIKDSHPDCYLGVLTSPIGKQVLENSPHIDEFFILERSRLFKLPRLLKSLRKKRFDTALIFHISQRVALPLVALSGVKNIYGTQSLTKGFDHLLTQTFSQANTYHEIQRRLDIAEALPLKARKNLLEVFPSQEDRYKALSLLPPYKNKLIVVLHPGAKDRFKMWDTGHFISLGNLLKNSFNVQIYITGNFKESYLCETIASQIEGAINLAGQLSVLQTAALLSLSHLFISNDTGPMHLGFAVKTKTIALFCATHSKLCGPFMADNVFIIQKEKTCEPCIGKKCRSPFCMLQISPEEVYRQAAIFLNDKKQVYADVSL